MLKNFLSISLIIVILGLNSGLTFITHYCDGEAVESSFSLTQADLDCGMSQEEMKSCSNDKHNQKEVIHKKGCCENEYLSFDADFDYNQAQVTPNTHLDFKFAVAFAYSFVNNHLLLQKEKPSLEAYRPPLINQDISVLHQVFII
ncbi:hypothetical protein CW751_10205 [Brumimicrobium salinarum]|uniref:Uncharacterized protein n=1 Tax=Brumimicrobium salinarum TaxID=2058658 RepID=A0A2I0R1H6_9FLAO|nr:hypothetical protein [Brumimicrobium salinarum]PKR80428.1 hypothetical protein CW751_10205 [Brumimicrobium salinarum]